MDETLLWVKRAEGCDCDMVCLCLLVLTGEATLHKIDEEAQTQPECGHGSRVSVLNARVVECARCVGTGTIQRGPVAVARGWDAEVTCSDCLGTGLRLASMEAPGA